MNSIVVGLKIKKYTVTLPKVSGPAGHSQQGPGTQKPIEIKSGKQLSKIVLFSVYTPLAFFTLFSPLCSK